MNNVNRALMRPSCEPSRSSENSGPFATSGIMIVIKTIQITITMIVIVIIIIIIVTIMTIIMMIITMV